MSAEFNNVKLQGGLGKLVLAADKISFQPNVKTKKTLNWPWSAVKSHEELKPAFKSTWVMTVTVRGTITEQIFTCHIVADNQRLAWEAYSTSTINDIITPFIYSIPPDNSNILQGVEGSQRQ